MDRKKSNIDKLGQQFVWFEGVVEDVNDPKGLGRVKVRVLGDHTQDKEKIATKQLPWASVVLPVTMSGMQGMGGTPVGLLPGSWVFGFYRDGYDKQQPMILGSVAGIPEDPPSKDIGFNDPYEIFPIKEQLNEPDTNRLALGSKGEYPNYEKHDVHKTSIEEVQRGMPGCAETWSEPQTEREPVYPYNKVYEGIHDPKVNQSKWGHVEEWDSTPNKERYFRWHKTSHNSLEIWHDGKEVHRIFGDHFELDLARKLIRVDGDYKLTVRGNVDEHICGDKWSYIEGNLITVVDGDIVTATHSKAVTHADKGIINKTKKSITEVANENITIAGNGSFQCTAREVHHIASSSAAIGTGGIPIVDVGEVEPTGMYTYTPYTSVILSTMSKNTGTEESTGNLYSSVPTWEGTFGATLTDFFHAVPNHCYIMKDLDVYKSIATTTLDVSIITRTTILSTLKMMASGPFRGGAEALYMIPTSGTMGREPQSTAASSNAIASYQEHVYTPVIIDVKEARTNELWQEEEKCEGEEGEE